MKKGMSVLMNYQPKEDETSELIETMGHSLSFLVMGVLEAKTDEFEMNLVKLQNVFKFIQEEKAKWNLEYETWDIIGEAKTKRTHVYEAMKQVPTTHLMRLAEIKRNHSTNSPGIRMILQGGYTIIGVWVDTVLQKHYRFTIEKRKQFFTYLNDWIDSYYRGYLDNAGIRQQFIEDLGYDILKGEKVGEPV